MADKDATFLDTLKDIAERQTYKTLPEMAKATNSDSCAPRSKSTRTRPNGQIKVHSSSAPSNPLAKAVKGFHRVILTS